jgi:hypothetical protein
MTIPIIGPKNLPKYAGDATTEGISQISICQLTVDEAFLEEKL